MALAGPLLMPAAPAQPEAGGLAVKRLGPDQVPEQTAHFRHGERQQIGVEVDHAFFPPAAERITASQACASIASVMWRCQPVQERTSY
jgi:hypothetical protein